MEDARRGRRYEREGRILKKRVEQPDDSHSDGELEVLNREENIDFDPEADPSGLPLIVDPEGVCYLPDEVRASPLAEEGLSAGRSSAPLDARRDQSTREVVHW